jgi:hypothetical protein
MMIEALPAWQSHYSIGAIGNLYVARHEPFALSVCCFAR